MRHRPPATANRKSSFLCAAGDGIELRLRTRRDAQPIVDLGIWSPQDWTDEDYRRRMEAPGMYHTGRGVPCVILVDGQRAGYVTLDIEGKRGSIHFGLARAYRGKGIATKACAALIEHAFTKLKLESFNDWVQVRNHKSCAVLERLGFARKGRRLATDEHGRRHFSVQYVLTRSDWRQGRRRSGRTP